MKYRKYIFVIILFLPLTIFAQEAVKSSRNGTPASARHQRKVARKKWKEERKKEKLDRTIVDDHHKRIQTKKVQKRMRKDKRKAQRNNEHKKDYFWNKWF